MGKTAGDGFIMPAAEPLYFSRQVRDSLGDRAIRALQALRCCHSCPRNCGIDRMVNETKVCRIGRYARVSSAFAHHGEEYCLRGTQGSGTIFFTSCNLRCVFCQNWDISQRVTGRMVDGQTLAWLMLSLQEKGCHNINLVTPEHVVPQVVEALTIAVDQGLKLPVIYNTSAYDALSSLALLEGLVDVYMPDFKFWDPATAERLVGAEDYPQRAREAIREMHRQVGVLRFTETGLACRGVLVRHLVMPGLVEDSAAIFRWLADELSCDTFVNIMGQYHPAHRVGGYIPGGSDVEEVRFQDINCRTSAACMNAAFEAAQAAGLWRFDNR